MKVKGDRAEIVRRDLLQRYPFPQIVGEKFIPESFLWYSLAKDGYKFRWHNVVGYIAEYLDDGLTRNGRELARENSKYRSCHDNLVQSIIGIPFKEKLKAAINYYRYCLYANISAKKLFQESSNQVLSIIAFPIAKVMKIK